MRNTREIQQWGDRHTQQDEILREILLELRKNSDGGKTSTTSGRLLSLAERQEKRIMDIRFFTYPADGTLASLAAGTHVFDFMAGTYTDENGTVTQLQHNLQNEGKDALRSIYVNSDKAVTVQLGTSDVIFVGEEKDMQGTYQNFTKVKVTTTAVSTAFFMLCCTNPEAILTLVDKASQIIGGKQLVIGSKIDLDGTSSYFETDQALGATPTLSITLTPATVYKFKINSIRYYMDWDGVATGYQLYLFEDAQADDVQNLSELVYDGGSGKADGVHYVEIGSGVLPIEVDLETAATLYYMVDWAGAPGNVKGFVEIRGEIMS